MAVIEIIRKRKRITSRSRVEWSETIAISEPISKVVKKEVGFSEVVEVVPY